MSLRIGPTQRFYLYIKIDFSASQKKKRWLNGCSCGEKFARYVGEFSDNFSGEISIG